MSVDPEKVRAMEIDYTDTTLPVPTRRAIEAYYLTRTKPGGSLSLANLVDTLFELYPSTDEEIASSSGTLATLSPSKVRRLRKGLAEDVLYVEVAEICNIFDVDCAYLRYPRASPEDLDPRVATARAFREHNPHIDTDDLLRNQLHEYAKSASMSLTTLVDKLCHTVFPKVRVPNPEEVTAFLTGLDIRPQFLDAAAGKLMGYPYHVYKELWGEGWWRNDLRP